MLSIKICLTYTRKNFEMNKDLTWVLSCIEIQKNKKILSFFWSVFFCIRTEYEFRILNSVQIQENTGQKKLRIWILFTQCECIEIK